jgi:hypothetical protein
MRFVVLLAVLLCTGCFDRPQSSAEVLADKQNAAAQRAALDGLATTASAGTDAATARGRADAALADARQAAEAAEQRRAAAQKARDLVVAQSSSNLGPIAAAVRAKEFPVYAETILAQKQTIDTAIALPAAEYPKPQVSVEDLLRDAEASLQVYRKDAEAIKARLTDLSMQQKIAEATAKTAADRADKAEAAQRAAEAKVAEALEAAKVSAVKLQTTLELKDAAEKAAKEEARMAMLAKWGAGAAAAAIPLILALLNGAAGGGLGTIGALARAFIPAAGRLRDGLETAKVAVASADVGRAALSRLEGMLRISNPELIAQLSTQVAQATGGRAASIEDLFKLAAQSHVVDLGGGRMQSVINLLTSIRDERIDTTGGMPDTLLHILPKA